MPSWQMALQSNDASTSSSACSRPPLAQRQRAGGPVSRQMVRQRDSGDEPLGAAARGSSPPHPAFPCTRVPLGEQSKVCCTNLPPLGGAVPHSIQRSTRIRPAHARGRQRSRPLRHSSGRAPRRRRSSCSHPVLPERRRRRGGCMQGGWGTSSGGRARNHDGGDAAQGERWGQHLEVLASRTGGLPSVRLLLLRAILHAVRHARHGPQHVQHR